MEPSFSPNAIQKQILKFFREHSNAVETVRGIATWLGHDPQAVQAALDGLVDRKLLLSHQTGVVIGYALNTDEKVLGQIGDSVS